jgi:hypothetical protein
MTEMSPRFVRDANNTESPNRFSKEWKELAQGASIIEDQTIALASDTKAEPGDVREKRSEMPEPAYTARVDISDNEQSADKMSMDSPQFVEETRIESPTKTCEECIELAQGADFQLRLYEEPFLAAKRKKFSTTESESRREFLQKGPGKATGGRRKRTRQE